MLDYPDYFPADLYPPAEDLHRRLSRVSRRRERLRRSVEKALFGFVAHVVAKGFDRELGLTEQELRSGIRAAVQAMTGADPIKRSLRGLASAQTDRRSWRKAVKRAKAEWKHAVREWVDTASEPELAAVREGEQAYGSEATEELSSSPERIENAPAAGNGGDEEASDDKKKLVGFLYRLGIELHLSSDVPGSPAPE